MDEDRSFLGIIHLIADIANVVKEQRPNIYNQFIKIIYQKILTSNAQNVQGLRYNDYNITNFRLSVLNNIFFYMKLHYVILTEDEIIYIHDSNLIKRYFPEFGEYTMTYDLMKKE